VGQARNRNFILDFATRLVYVNNTLYMYPVLVQLIRLKVKLDSC